MALVEGRCPACEVVGVIQCPATGDYQ
jgi:hypothetical protein